MGAPQETQSQYRERMSQPGQMPSSTPGYVNPVKPSDYSTVDFTQTGPGAGYAAAQEANMAQFTDAAMRAANQQALGNVRGVSGSYGAVGGGQSGAAYAAAAEGANRPLYEAQTQIADMRRQNTNDLYSQFSGVVAPQYMQTPSDLETAAGQQAYVDATAASKPSV